MATRMAQNSVQLNRPIRSFRPGWSPTNQSKVPLSSPRIIPWNENQTQKTQREEKGKKPRKGETKQNRNKNKTKTKTKAQQNENKTKQRQNNDKAKTKQEQNQKTTKQKEQNKTKQTKGNSPIQLPIELSRAVSKEQSKGQGEKQASKRAVPPPTKRQPDDPSSDKRGGRELTNHPFLPFALLSPSFFLSAAVGVDWSPYWP